MPLAETPHKRHPGNLGCGGTARVSSSTASGEPLDANLGEAIEEFMHYANELKHHVAQGVPCGRDHACLQHEALSWSIKYACDEAFHAALSDLGALRCCRGAARVTGTAAREQAAALAKEKLSEPHVCARGRVLSR